MSISVQSDILEGMSYSDSAQGNSITRVFYVHGLDSEAPHAKGDVAAHATGIPIRGEPHPSSPNMVATSIDVTPITSSQFKVVVKYEYTTGPQVVPDDTALPQLSMGATVQSKAVNKDIYGTPMSVKYTYKDVNEETGEITETPVEKGVEVEIQKPNVVARASRLETRSPLGKSVYYSGKINSGTFLGGAPGTWLCTRLEGDSQDNGRSWNVSYEFQYSPDGWDANVVFIDPETDAVPTDVEDGVGTKTYEVYERVDFSALRIE